MRVCIFPKPSRSSIPLAILALLATPAIGSCGKTGCVPGELECPKRIELKPGKPPVMLHGRLTHRRPNFSFEFSGQQGSVLKWNYNGPAVRTVLTKPTGETQGPGQPAAVFLD